MYITFWPVINLWSGILIVLFVIDTSEEEKSLGLINILLFASLYLTTTVVLMPSLTSMLTTSSKDNSCVPAVDTVAVFFTINPVTTFSFAVLKLWLAPVPIPVKNNNPPSVPTPT